MTKLAIWTLSLVIVIVIVTVTTTEAAAECRNQVEVQGMRECRKLVTEGCEFFGDPKCVGPYHRCCFHLRGMGPHKCVCEGLKSMVHQLEISHEGQRRDVAVKAARLPLTCGISPVHCDIVPDDVSF